MAREPKHTVVFLYEHPLLGEGIAKYLRAQTGVEATLVSARDPEAVRSALALRPQVIIFEANDPFEQFDLTRLAPHAVLIDVSTVITRGSVVTPTIAGLDQIVQAVRDSGGVDRGGVDSIGITRASKTCHIGTSASPAR